MIAPASIEIEICHSLRKSAADLWAAGHKDNTTWTEAIKRLLIDLGKKSGYQICTSGFPNETEPGWLYDLVWYQENEQRYLLDVPLVVESEWNENYGHIKFDFEKLIAARANHRLMVCQCRTLRKEERLEYFRNAIKTYRHCQPGDRYLIALLDVMDATYHFELLVLKDIKTVEVVPIHLP
ncbi:MAG: hypothetical protein J0H74_16325 [Chitinophagaceae bacterium]|nr:hypothetical protein [Chitinophagaceae bacterium]